MARLITITSTAKDVIDLNDPVEVNRNKDVLDFLVAQYNETLEEGEEPIKALSDARVDVDVLHDVIREALEEDVESVLDISDLTDGGNFNIEVL